MYKEYLKIFLIRLKNTFVYSILLNNYFLIALYIILLLLTISNIYLIGLIIIYTIFLFKKSKVILKIALLFSFIIIIHIIVIKCLYQFNNTDNQYLEVTGRIYQIEEKETYQKLIVRSGIKKYIIIDKEFTDLEIGNKIKISGNIKKISSAYNLNEFDYYKYLVNNKYNGYIISKDISLIDTKISIFTLKSYINNYLKIFPYEEQVFIKALLFSESNALDEDFYNSLKTNGIIHLFAVSGLHITLFLGFFEKVYQKLKVKNIIRYVINILFLLVYLIVTDFTPSILRVSVSYVIQIISKNFFKEKELSSLDIQSISFIILIIINPYNMYQLGFILSFMASFSIILSSEIVQNKNEIIQTIILSFITMIISLPIVGSMSYRINLLIPLINVLFIFLVSYIILPFTIICFMIPNLNKVYYYVITSFQEVSMFISERLNLSIRVPHMSVISTIIYYLILLSLVYIYKDFKNKCLNLYKKAYLGLVLLLLIFVTTANGFYTNNRIYFMYLENGESTLIVHDSTVILIDTGDGSKMEVSNFLLSLGIKKIDCLILTHNHNDHNGEAEHILSNFKVSKLVVSAYDNSRFSNYKQSIKVKKGDIIVIDEVLFEIISPNQKHSDVNDDSLVFVLNLFGKKFLFVGDLTTSLEKSLIDELYDIDILKVGHHGSSTSTSPLFLEKTNPEVAVIMTGRVKKFGFPHGEVIDCLNRYHITTYRTDKDYMIIYKNDRFFTTS